MFKALLNEKNRFAVDDSIRNRPNYRLYEQGGLNLTEHGQSLAHMEEAYMSHLADTSINVRGHNINPVAASERAFTSYLNLTRADTFDLMVSRLTKDGKKPTPEELKAIGKAVNVFTGRADLGLRENALTGLGTAFFAPRLVVSRFQVLAGQPLYKGSWATRKAVAAEYARFLAGVGTIYALAKTVGADVEYDPRSSEFGKIRFGKTRIDPLGGLSQATVLVSRLATGQTKTASGKINDIRGDHVPYGGSDSADVIARFLRTKLNPVVGTGVDIATGKNVVGEKVTAQSVAESAVMPMSFNDIYEAMKEQGIPAGSAMATLSLFGMGLMTYDTKRRISSSG